MAQFVFDAAEAGTLSEAGDELGRLLEQQGGTACPLIVVANKCDAEGGVDRGSLVEGLKLGDVNDREVAVLETSCVTGEGVEALAKLLEGHAARRREGSRLVPVASTVGYGIRVS